MADVKKVKDLRKEDLTHLSVESFEILKGYTKDSLVLMARREILFNSLMEARGRYKAHGSSPESLVREAILCKKASDEMTEALHVAGFIRKDFENYRISFNIMTFLRIILNDRRYNESYFDEFFNTRREWKTFSNNEYERFEGLTDEQIEQFMTLLHETLSERAYLIICLRMGLVGDGICVDRKSVATCFDTTEQEVAATEDWAFKQMAKAENRETLNKIFQVNKRGHDQKGLIRARC